MLTRRDVLAAFLGAPFAAIACRVKKQESLPPGVLAGASDSVGHRLRSPSRERPGNDAWENRKIVIVGGGVAGLSAAWRLTHAGENEFVLLELEQALGGTAKSGRSEVSAYPWGAHYVPAPMAQNRALVRLFNEMSLLDGVDEEGEPRVAEQFVCRDPEERLFYRGRWYEGLYLRAGASDDDLRQLHEFESEVARWAGWRDARGRRAFAIPTSAGSDDAEVMALDKLSARQWLDGHRWTSPRLRWYVEYACRDDYGTLLDDTSAWAVLFYFASRVRSAGSDTRPLMTWPEGNGRLVGHLARSAAGRARAGWLVTDLQPVDGGVDVVAMSSDGSELRGIHARAVIFAGPQFVARHVIAPFRDAAPAHIAAFQYGSWMVANLTLRDRPHSEGFPLAWDNVLYESPALGYVVATHQSDADFGPTVLTYYYPLCDRDPHHARQRLLSAGRDAWADVALSDLSRAHGDLRSLTERVDVMRWGHAMVRPHVGFIASAERQAARQPFRGIHFAHSDLSGVALFEEAFDHGLRAAEEVLRIDRPDAESFRS